MRARNQLLRLSSVVSKRRLPITWASELMKNVVCHNRTRLAKNAMNSPGQPHSANDSSANKVGGTRWYLFNQTSSGYLVRSLTLLALVSDVLSKIQPRWL